MDLANLKSRARAIRKRILRMNSQAGQGHTGGDLSEVDILVALYFHILRHVDPRADFDFWAALPTPAIVELTLDESCERGSFRLFSANSS